MIEVLLHGMVDGCFHALLLLFWLQHKEPMVQQCPRTKIRRGNDGSSNCNLACQAVPVQEEMEVQPAESQLFRLPIPGWALKYKQL